MIVLHYTGMPDAEGALDRLTSPEAKVSCHYLVDEDGTVYRLVDEADRAWHAGKSRWRGITDVNSASVGLEIVNPGHEFGYREFPDEQMASVIPLVADIKERHGIGRGDVVGHSDVAAARKEDPGELFPWHALAKRRLALPSPTRDLIDPYWTDAGFLLALERFGYDVTDPQKAVIAFQRRFRPDLIDGIIDGECRAKRFGLDGGESAVPALEAVIKYGGQMGVTEIDVGMAHRGRLNVLTNVMGKKAEAIFHEFAGGATNPADVGGSGDVKYHLGTSSDREFEGNKVHLALLPNPSHLEAVDPVVLGKARAVMTYKGDLEGKKVLPMLLHGDAAFAGQGVVWECLSFSGLPGYGTGGTIHFIINNQIGFTTSPQFGRSSPYPSDVAKGIQAPILHVNGDDPEAVTFCCKMATEFRQAFNRDAVIDRWCYRRFGHNEGDEPSFTQPLMYAAIKQQRPISAIYAERLLAEKVVDQSWIEQQTKEYVAHLEDEFGSATSYLPNKADWFEGRWAGLGRPDEPVLGRRNTETAISDDEMRRLGEVLTTVPSDFHIHKTLQRILDAKKAMFDSGEGFDWATAEALAFGSLVAEGNGVRLSGQDSGRGTFSQRHAVWLDQQTGEKYIPLCHVESDSGGGRFEVRDRD